MRFDLCGDVVALGLERYRRQRTRDGVHGGIVLRIQVDGERLLEACHRHDVVDRQRHHRTAGAQVLEIRIRVLDQREIHEIVGAVVVAHVLTLCSRVGRALADCSTTVQLRTVNRAGHRPGVAALCTDGRRVVI